MSGLHFDSTQPLGLHFDSTQPLGAHTAVGRNAGSWPADNVIYIGGVVRPSVTEAPMPEFEFAPGPSYTEFRDERLRQIVEAALAPAERRSHLMRLEFMQDMARVHERVDEERAARRVMEGRLDAINSAVPAAASVRLESVEKDHAKLMAVADQRLPYGPAERMALATLIGLSFSAGWIVLLLLLLVRHLV